MSNPKCFHISSSAASAIKACPVRYRLGYREGLRLNKDTDSQRVGTNWHAMHEVHAGALHEAEYLNAADCIAEGGVWDKERQKAWALEQTIEHLNERYLDIPSFKAADEWALEQQILLTSFIGYLWYWADDPFEILATELKFELTLTAPKVQLPLPTAEVIRRGKIDHLGFWQGMIGNLERKSTSRGIGPDSDFWDRSKKDTQVSMYALACRDMLKAGTLPQEVLDHPAFLPSRLGNTVYDVWHKPTIKPAKLTQGDTKKFLETGVYYDVQFKVEIRPPESGEMDTVRVDEIEAEVIPGKKANAIRETTRMYGARLLADITKRPEFYFQRREIARTDQDLERFETDLFNIYQMMRLFDKSGCWFENEAQCRATFHCSYIPICYGPGSDAVCDGKTTPDGFKRIFGEALDTPSRQEE